ncbi:MAG: RNA-binding protein, partial [Desulfobulbus sp.]|nr:RNA-binding protein [Desulfobulbus sp.]
TGEAETVEPAPVETRTERRRPARVSEPAVEPTDRADDEATGEAVAPVEEEPEEPPSAEALEQIRADLGQLLELMGFPSEVRVVFEDNTVHCTITGAHEEQIVGPEGRTLDSLQYLLRKMVAACVPDRIMLALDAGGFRERRAGELRERALELAEQVKADGKTQAIPALNPSERRVVHMALQEDKGVRSRSVGEGLFKKVLIYKPGKGRRPSSRKRRGGQGGRTSGD